jgi:flagellar biogenesis protein FliO
MWDLIKNDPILKAISVFVLGIFAFSFAFSIMFGSGQSGMDHGASSGGYSAVNSFGTIIILLSKLLIIILLIAIIIAAVKFIQKHIVGNEPIKGIDTLKNKPLSAVLLGIAGILIVLYMISMILPSNSSNNMMSSSIYYSHNNSGFGITAILTSIVRLITALSFIGLITGLVMYFKRQYFTNVESTSKSVNSASPVSKVLCSNCGLELKDNWKCCPGCGVEKQSKEEKSKEELKITLADNEEK